MAKSQNRLGELMERFPIPPGFKELVAQLEPIAPGRRRRILALLDNRVGWSAVRHWLEGRNKPPRWVRQCLAAELSRRSIAASELAAAMLQAKEKAR